jgi:pimeloyl-ACP methyl ester carboxylesterase
VPDLSLAFANGPAGLARRLDLGRIGMFGVSAGGFTAAQAMAEDPRIKAGVDLDGATDSPIIPGSSHLLPVFTTGLRQPFMFMGDPQTSWRTVASWRSFWTRTPGWHLDLTLRGASGENAYQDALPLLPQVAAQTGLPVSVVTKDLGTVQPGPAVSAEEAYVSAFFGHWLRGQDGHLLTGPSPRYPQIAFIR